MTQPQEVVATVERLTGVWDTGAVGVSPGVRRDVEVALAGLQDAAYGGAPLRVQVGYWLRPFDVARDRRVWRWRRSRCRAWTRPGGP